MIKHIVLFKLKTSLSEAEKLDIATRFKAAIEALPAEIACIDSISVASNCNVNETWDICLESTFASLADLSEYAKHPAHIAAASIIAEAKCDRACVDYAF